MGAAPCRQLFILNRDDVAGHRPLSRVPDGVDAQRLDVDPLFVHRPQTVGPQHLRFAAEQAFEYRNHLRSFDDFQDLGYDTVRVNVNRPYPTATHGHRPAPGSSPGLKSPDGRIEVATAKKYSRRGGRRCFYEIPAVRHGPSLYLCRDWTRGL